MSKRTAQGAASAASTQEPTTGTTPGADSAGAAAVAKTPETPPAGDTAVEATPAYTFPLTVVIRNHAGLAFPEPVTGAYLPGGGSATVTLHDEEFAEQVADSLRNIVETNYLAPGALAVEPA